MNVSAPFISRPVATTLLTLAIALAGIMGFRIPIAKIEGKFKISQNRSEVERSNIRKTQAAGTPDEQALAAWMERFGI